MCHVLFLYIQCGTPWLFLHKWITLHMAVDIFHQHARDGGIVGSSNTVECIMPAKVTEWSQELPNCNSTLNHIPPDPAMWKQWRRSPDSLMNKGSQVDLFIAPAARGQYATMWAMFILSKRGSDVGGRPPRQRTARGLQTEGALTVLS